MRGNCDGVACQRALEYPIGAVLVESFVISGLMPLAKLKAVTEEALEKLPPGERASLISRWSETANQTEEVDATTAAFELNGVPVDWDRKAAYSDQVVAMAAARRALPADQRTAIHRDTAIAHVMLHKRTAPACSCAPVSPSYRRKIER